MQKKISVMFEYQFLKPIVKLVLTWKFEAFATIHRQMVALLIFSKICQKCFLFANIRYLRISMSVICAKGNKAVTYSGHTNVYFTINGPLKMLPRHFRYFHCSNFKMTFDKTISSMSQNFAFW